MLEVCIESCIWIEPNIYACTRPHLLIKATPSWTAAKKEKRERRKKSDILFPSQTKMKIKTLKQAILSQSCSVWKNRIFIWYELYLVKFFKSLSFLADELFSLHWYHAILPNAWTRMPCDNGSGFFFSFFLKRKLTQNWIKG